MTRTVLAVFDSVYSAKKAAWELQKIGLPNDMINILTQRSDQDQHASRLEDEHSEVESHPKNEIRVDSWTAGLQTGFSVGGAVGVAGGFLAAIGALPIILPVVGHLTSAVAALTAASMSTIAGGVIGGLLGTLINLNLPDEEMHQYARTVQEDQVVVAVLADWDAVDTVNETLLKYAPLQIEQHSYNHLETGGTSKILAKRPIYREHHERR